MAHCIKHKISCIEVINNQTSYTAYFIHLYYNFPILKFIRYRVNYLTNPKTSFTCGKVHRAGTKLGFIKK